MIYRQKQHKIVNLIKEKPQKRRTSFSLTVNFLLVLKFSSPGYYQH